MTVLLIDGDVICYQACESRFGDIVTLDKDCIPYFTEEEDRKYLEDSWNRLLKIIENLCDFCYTTENFIAVKGDDNFRHIMYPDYKRNRKRSTIRNTFVPILRKKLAMKGLAVEAHGRESDDLLRIWAEECRKNNTDFIVCSNDKDLRCIPGKYLELRFDYKQRAYDLKIIEITEEEANRHFYEQLLKGDNVDFIPGLPGVGQVKAKRLLANATTEKEFQEIVVSNYISHYQDDWYSYLLSNGKMLYLQKHPDDYFEISDWEVVKELCS